MMRIAAFCIAGVTLASAQTTTEAPPLDIQYNSDKEIDTADLTWGEEVKSGDFVASATKTFTLTTALNEVFAEEGKDVEAGFLVDTSGTDPLVDAAYLVEYGAAKDGSYGDGAWTNDGAVFVGKDGAISFEGENGEYEGNSLYTLAKNIGLGTDASPLLRAGKAASWAATATATVEPDTLTADSNVAGTKSANLVLGDDALSFTQNSSINAARGVVVDPTDATISKTASGTDTKTFGVDQGPVRISATQTNTLLGSNLNIEDLEALRTWVDATEPAALKLVVLKMLDYNKF